MMSTSVRTCVPVILLLAGLVAGYVPLNGFYYPWYNAVVISGQSGRAQMIQAAWMVGCLLALIAVLGWLNRRRNSASRLGPIDSLVIAFAAWLLLSGLVMKVPWPTFAVGIFPHVAVGLFYFLGRGMQIELRHVAVATVLAATVLATSVLLDAEGFMHRAPQRPGGLLGSRNFAAEYLALALPAILILFSRAESGAWPRKLFVVLGTSGALLTGAALVVTRSRTSWIAAMAGTTIILALSRERRRVLVPIGLIALGAVIGGNTPTKLTWKEEHPIRSTASRLLDVSSGSGKLRRDQYSAVFTIARQHPLLGLGPGHWRKGIMAESGNEQLRLNVFPNSDYLRVLCEGGFLALALFMGLGALLVRHAWLERASHPQALAFLIALALVSAADPPIARPESAILVCTTVAALVNHARQSSRDANPTAADPESATA